MNSKINREMLKTMLKVELKKQNKKIASKDIEGYISMIVDNLQMMAQEWIKSDVINENSGFNITLK